MKKVLLIASVAICFGCSKSTEKPKTNNPSVQITGKWYDVKDVYSTTKNGITTIVDTQLFNRTKSILFNSDASGTGNDAYFNNSFTYSIASNNLQLTETTTINSIPQTFTWSVPIKKIDNNTLELYFVIGPDNTGYSENHDVTYSR